MNKNNRIFDILRDIDARQISSFEDIGDEYNPYMTMRWMASCKDSNRVTRVNELLNVVTFGLSSDKKLLYYLSCALSDGESKRYQWIKKYKEEPTIISVVSEYFHITPREARTVIHLYDKNSIIEMAVDLGYDDKELKKLSSKLI